MKKIWTKEQVEFLEKWYPHFGKCWVAKELGYDARRVKAKIDGLGILLLPKCERLCIKCRKNTQKFRRTGYSCSACFNSERSLRRKTQTKSLTERFNEVLRSARHRAVCTIDTAYLLALWEKQKGICYYTNLEMVFQKWGTAPNYKYRHPLSPTLDKIDPLKGYVDGNVVFCCRAANLGKSNFPIAEYVKICSRVAIHHADVLAELANS